MDQATFDAAKKTGKRSQGTVVDKWRQLVEATGRKDLSWASADADLLRDAIAAATDDGAALLFSKTSDGGALVVKVINDKVTTPLYPASTQALHSTLELIAQVANKP